MFYSNSGCEPSYSNKIVFSSEFHFTDPIQIRVGLKNCLAQMSAAAEEKQFEVAQFYEVYETDCAHYTFCIWFLHLYYYFSNEI